jgi:ubiquitin-protein ligase
MTMTRRTRIITGALLLLIHTRVISNAKAPFQKRSSSSSSLGANNRRSSDRKQPLSSGGVSKKSEKSHVVGKTSRLAEEGSPSSLLASNVDLSVCEETLCNDDDDVSSSSTPSSAKKIDGPIVIDTNQVERDRRRKTKKTKKKNKKPPTAPTVRITATAAAAKKKSPASTKKMRLQREWKDTVAAGMGFDWKKGRPVRYRDQNALAEEQPQSASSCIWLGPIQSMDKWHFSFRGIGDPYEQGLYHGVVVVPADYPYGPPKIQLWTPSGRFQTHKNLCLSVSNYHPETWRPTLSICSIVESVRLHMMTPADNAIGSIADSYAQRQSYARASRRYVYQPIRRHAGSSDIDHGNMIRHGWVEGIQQQQELHHDEMDEYDGQAVDDDDRSIGPVAVLAPASSTLLQEILWQKPLRMFLVGAFLVLFLVLQLR